MNKKAPAELKRLLKDFQVDRSYYISRIMRNFGIVDIELDKGVSIFGIGLLGRKVAKNFRRNGILVNCFSDNNPTVWGSEVDGIPVVSPENMRKTAPIVIASKYVKEIFLQLKKMGFMRCIPHYVMSVLFPTLFPNTFYSDAFGMIQSGHELIEEAFELLSDRQSKALFMQLIRFRLTLSPDDLPRITVQQYFPKDIVNLRRDETFVDVGAFVGDTFQLFCELTQSEFVKYYAIEPDAKNYHELVRNIPNNIANKVITLNVGVGAQEGESRFTGSEGEISSIDDGGKVIIKIISLDSLFVGANGPSMIKVDVEGVEPEVLEGSIRTIRRYTPTIAVSAYHRPNHLWELIRQVHYLSSDYSFFLRHHEYEIYDTVLYCMPSRHNKVYYPSE